MFVFVKLIDDGSGFMVKSAFGVNDQNRYVGIGNAAPGRGYHCAIQSPFGFENSRGVNEYDLSIFKNSNAADQRTGRLHFGRHDRHLGTDKVVGDCGLSGIRCSDEGNEAATRRQIFFGFSRHAQFAPT